MRHIRAITEKTAHCLRSKANAALLAEKKRDSVLVLSSNTGLYHYLILLV